MANVENVEEMVGTREAAAVATESSGAVATESGGAVITGDETVATASDETAATGGVMYLDEGLYTIDVRHFEEMVGTTREAADGDRVRRGLGHIDRTLHADIDKPTSLEKNINNLHKLNFMLL